MKLKTYAAMAVLPLAVAFAAFAAPIDWESAPVVQKGVRLVHIERTEPRLMKAYMMRIDLKTPGLRFTGSTTMIYWDGKRVVRVNRHDPKRMYWRKNGVNMGIYIE